MSLGDFIDTNYLGKIYKNGWKTSVLKFFSTTEESTVLTDSHITGTDWLAYNTELEKLGNAVLIDSDTDILNKPYPSRLRPLDDYSFLSRVENVTIVNFVVTCFDMTKHGSAHQNATVNTLIKNSLNTDNPYPQTSFTNTIPVTWLRNYFNPEIKINGTDVFTKNSFNGFGKQNKGDRSIGWNLPMGINIYENYKGGINSIDIKAACRQIIVNGSDYYAKAYPLKLQMVICYA